MPETPTPDEILQALPHAVVCYTQCWSCQFDCHFAPPQVHTWMDQEDAEHAGHPWPLPADVAAANRCGCNCAKPAPAQTTAPARAEDERGR